MPTLFFLTFIFLSVISCLDKSFPLVIGHRGAMGYIAENTIPSIEKAIELFEDSKFCIDYYSKEYVTMYADLKRKEIESFRSEISDIEYKWYLNL